MFAEETTELISSRKGLVQFKQSWTSYRSGFVKILSMNRDNFESFAFGRGLSNENLILDKRLPLFDRVQVLRCLRRGQTLRFRRKIYYVLKM